MRKTLFQAATSRLAEAARSRLPQAQEQLARARQGAAHIKARLEESLRAEVNHADPSAALTKTGKDALSEAAEEPPVVARLVVEIRSDGTRTIARGALADELTGERVAIEARGNSPLELAGQLARSLITSPLGRIGWGTRRALKRDTDRE